MAETTTRFALPLLQVAQAQKEVTHNEAVAAVDALLHLAVESRTLAAPPAAPAVGQAWIVAAGASGAWTGRDGAVAAFGEGGWRYTPPRSGMVAWLADTARFAVFDGAWRDDGWPVAGLRIGARLVLGVPPVALAAPSGGVTIDVETRAALADLVSALRAQGLVAA